MLTIVFASIGEKHKMKSKHFNCLDLAKGNHGGHGGVGSPNATNLGLDRRSGNTAIFWQANLQIPFSIQPNLRIGISWFGL